MKEAGPGTGGLSAFPRRPPPYPVAAVFIVLAAGVLWVPSRWVMESAHRFHDFRTWTPARLSGGEASGPSLSARPPLQIRMAPAGPRPVAFRLLAPAAQSVRLGGSFNEYDAGQNPLLRGEDGVWETTLMLNPGRHSYKFKVDGEWQLDPTNPERSPAPKESSLIDVP